MGCGLARPRVSPYATPMRDAAASCDRPAPPTEDHGGGTTAGAPDVLSGGAAAAGDGDCEMLEMRLKQTLQSGSPSNSDGKVKTLSNIEPGVSSRHQYYQDKAGSGRSSLKQNMLSSSEESGGGTSSMDPGLELGGVRPQRQNSKRHSRRILSNLVEIEADVQYRFTVVVVGSSAEDVIRAACESPEALQLPQAREDGQSQRACAPADVFYRCLCRVNNPLLQEERREADGTPLYAKLVFYARSFDSEMPRCATHYEALNTLVVFAISLGDTELEIREQLDQMTQVITKMRESSRARLRPVRAVLLFKESSDGVDGLDHDSSEETWAPCVLNYEEANGNLWKFGPVNLKARGNVHTIFAELVSTRIAHNQTGETSLKGLYKEPAREDLEKEGRETENMFQDLDAPEHGSGSDDGGASVTSGTSEGYQRPPNFSAEEEGSVCSEGAMEMHARLFGLE